MKNYQAPVVSLLLVSNEDVISTSGVKAGGAGDLSNMKGIDFANW
jgi:hypothetical protein